MVDINLGWWIDQSLSASTVQSLDTLLESARSLSNSKQETKNLVVKARKVKEEHILLKARAGKKLMKKRVSKW